MLCKRSPAEALPSISVGTRVGEFTQVGMTFCRSVCFCFVLLTQETELMKLLNRDVLKIKTLFLDSGDSGSRDIDQTTCMSCLKEGKITQQTLKKTDKRQRND